MDELKPCPFCGEQPHITEGHLPAYWYVDCGNVDCHAQPSVSCRSHLGRVEVINQWNTRTDPKLEALREILKQKMPTLRGNGHLSTQELSEIEAALYPEKE